MVWSEYSTSPSGAVAVPDGMAALTCRQGRALPRPACRDPGQRRLRRWLVATIAASGSGIVEELKERCLGRYMPTVRLIGISDHASADAQDDTNDNQHDVTSTIGLSIHAKIGRTP